MCAGRLAGGGSAGNPGRLSRMDQRQLDRHAAIERAGRAVGLIVDASRHQAQETIKERCGISRPGDSARGNTLRFSERSFARA